MQFISKFVWVNLIWNGSTWRAIIFILRYQFTLKGVRIAQIALFGPRDVSDSCVIKLISCLGRAAGLLLLLLLLLFCFVLFGEGGRLPVFCWLVGVPPICYHCHLAKKCGREKRIVLCLPNLSLRTVGTLISRTSAYAGCGRPTPNWAFWLGSLRSDSEVTSPRVSRALAAAAPYVQIMSNCLAWMST